MDAFRFPRHEHHEHAFGLYDGERQYGMVLRLSPLKPLFILYFLCHIITAHARQLFLPPGETPRRT